MARSYTQLRNTYGVDTKNTATANLTQGDEWMNDYHRALLVKADWPFLHRDRSIESVQPTSVVTVVAATDIFTTASGTNVLTETGTQVTFTTTGTLPAGITTSTTYYLIFQTSTTFQVASTYANAIAGTEIDITDTGKRNTHSERERRYNLSSPTLRHRSSRECLCNGRHNPLYPEASAESSVLGRAPPQRIIQ